MNRAQTQILFRSSGWWAEVTATLNLSWPLILTTITSASSGRRIQIGTSSHESGSNPNFVSLKPMVGRSHRNPESELATDSDHDYIGVVGKTDSDRNQQS